MLSTNSSLFVRCVIIHDIIESFFLFSSNSNWKDNGPAPSDWMWCIFSIAGNKSEVMRRKEDFMRYFRMNVASMTGSEYDQVVVNSIVYTPHLIINASLDWSEERGKRIINAMTALSKHNETLLDLSGIHYNVTDFHTAETLMAPKPIGPYMVGSGIGFKSADSANNDGGDVSINTSTGGVEAKEIEMMIYTGVGMIIAFLLTASLFFAVCQCVHKRPRASLISNERTERKENRLSRHHDMQTNSENNDCRNSFDLGEYGNRIQTGLMTNSEQNDTLRRPPNLIYSQDFSQSLNSCDPRIVYTPMTDHSNIEDDDRNEEASFIRHHIIPEGANNEAFSRPVSYGHQTSSENIIYRSETSGHSQATVSPSSSVSSRYLARNVPQRRSIGNPLSPRSETNGMVLPRSHSRDALNPLMAAQMRDINILEELRKGGQSYRTLQHPPNLRPHFHQNRDRGVNQTNFSTLNHPQFSVTLPKTGNPTNSALTQQLRHTCQSRRPNQPKRPNSVASTPIGRNHPVMNSNTYRRNDSRRPTFRNHPVPNRYEYIHPATGHFSDGADLLTDTDTSVDGGVPAGENYWQIHKPTLMLSTFRPISASSSSRISPNPNNSDLPASSVSSNSQQPSPNYNFSPESLIPSFVIPPPPSHDTGMISSPDGQVLANSIGLEVIPSPHSPESSRLLEGNMHQRITKPSEEQIQRDVQVVFENMGLQEKHESTSRPESRTVTFSEPPSTSE